MSYPDDFPEIPNPHPTSGYDWQLPGHLRPKALVPGYASDRLLLRVAKEARQVREIWETLVAEQEYWSLHGRKDELGNSLNYPMNGFYMVSDFYANYAYS